MPILAIGDIPEPNAVFGMKVCAAKTIRMKQPLTMDNALRWRLRPDRMEHHVIRMQTEQHIRRKGIVIHTLMIFLRKLSDRGRADVPAQGEAACAFDGHKATDKGACDQVILP